MASEEEEECASEVKIGADDKNFDEKTAPGRAVEPLLQNEYDDERTVSVVNNKPKLTSQHRIIAEIEAESSETAVNHMPKSVSIVGLSQSDEATDEELPSCSKGDLSPIIDRQYSELSWSAKLHHHKKHVFVLSIAGKPIYSRYGNEEDHSTLTGVMQALVSFTLSQNSDDELNHIVVGCWKFVFVHRSPLILVAASQSSESVSQLRLQLILIYNQILSVLTYSCLVKIFEQRKNFDLRRLLSGTERTLESLIWTTEHDPSHLLNAVKCNYLSTSVRDSIGQVIVHYVNKTKNVVFAMLIANNQLVTMCRMKKYTLHPSDLVLIINLVAANPSFKNAESWSPICLPRFDNTGFLHAHISYLADECNACLLMLTVDKTAFFSLSEIKGKIVDKFTKNKILVLLKDACNMNKGLKLSEMLINDLWHFLYKNRTSSQYTCPDFERPYVTVESQQHLFKRYLEIHNYMHSYAQQLKIFYVTGDKESVLGWITTNFELYAVFSPLTTKSAAIGKVDKLLRCLKKEEEQLFILNPPLF